MKITDLDVRVVRLGNDAVQWHKSLPPLRPQLSFITVHTDEDVQGTSSTWLPGPLHEVADAVEEFLRPLLIGHDPADRAALWQEFQQLEYFFPIRSAASAIDIALWDVLAKSHDLPLHRLIGNVRDRLPTYASVPALDSVSEALAALSAAQELACHGLKLHVRGPVDKDIVLCEALRDAAGPEFILMLDPVNSYTRLEARRAAHVLERLSFTWFEAPLADDDVAGYRDLRRHTRVPISNGEVRSRGLRDYWSLAAAGAVDILRCAADVQGGVTGLLKVGALAEASGLGMELRAYGSGLVQAVHLHAALCIPACRYFEVPVPKHWLDFGMAEIIQAAPDGFVAPSSRPGLGLTVDWNAVDDATVLRVGLGGTRTRARGAR